MGQMSGPEPIAAATGLARLRRMAVAAVMAPALACCAAFPAFGGSPDAAPAETATATNPPATPSAILAYGPMELGGNGVLFGSGMVDVIRSHLDPGVTVGAETMPASRLRALLDEGTMPVCAFLVHRLPHNETTRQWIGQVTEARIVLAAARPDLPMPAPDQPVLVIAGSAHQLRAETMGLAVAPARSHEQLLRMFAGGRSAYWLDNLQIMRNAQARGLTGPIHIVREVARVGVWMACSLSVDGATVDHLRTAFARARADGRMDDLLFQFQTSGSTGKAWPEGEDGPS
ncbi:MAG: hypothetical protein RLY86_2978 [Pseudomonadota bacterium]